MLSPVLDMAASHAVAYMRGVGERSVFPKANRIERLRQAMDADLPDSPTDSRDILGFLDEYVAPATVASTGGRYFGFVTGGAMPVTIASHWLATAWDQNCFSHASSPAMAIMEESALRWLLQLLELPENCEGTLVTGGTMANLTCLAAARNAVLGEYEWDVERNGLSGAPAIRVVVGEQAHASIYKTLGLLGLGRDRVVSVPADSQGRMRVEQAEGPTIVCLQAGNVNSGAFDPADRIIPKTRRPGVWIHVDGAFGLWARAAGSLRHLARGMELADSWATDAHKWLNVPYDCGIALTRDPAALRASMSANGDYLMSSGTRDAIHVSPENSRRARALDVWVALKSLGRQGVAELVERNCSQARLMRKCLEQAGMEVLNHVVLNQVIVSCADAGITSSAIRMIQDGGVCWCGSTMWNSRPALRISFSSWVTTEDDVRRSAEAVIQAFRKSGWES